MKQRIQPTRSRAGVTHHASVVAMTPARALTSHLRRRYHERYKGRYRFYRVVFAFDLVLVGLMASLFLFDAALVFRYVYATKPGVSVTLVSPPLRASDTVPVAARLAVTDGKTHKDVSLHWTLPAWVDVVQATPPMSADGSVFLGELRPGVDRESHLLVHIKTTPGTMLPFTFTLQQAGIFGFPRTDVGGEQRLVQSGVLRAVSVVDVKGIVSEGSYPLLIANDGSATSSLLTLRLGSQDGAPDARFSVGGQSMTIRDLAPHEKRIVFIDIGKTTGSVVHLAWELQDGAQAVSSHEVNLDVAPLSRLTVKSPLHWIMGESSADVGYENAAGAARAFVSNPYVRNTEGPFRIVDLAQGSGQFSVPLSPTTTSHELEWSVLLIDDSFQGGVFGERVAGRLAETFPFSAEARYYTAIGDQIGIGPLPPRVGEKTSYWIVWRVGPMASDMKQLTMKAGLPENVRATGAFTSTVQGTFQTDGKSVTWVVPSLSAMGGEQATFAFEVALTPTAAQSGSVIPLVEKSSAEALDVSTGQQLESSAPPDTTDLPKDAKAKGKGKISG